MRVADCQDANVLIDSFMVRPVIVSHFATQFGVSRLNKILPVARLTDAHEMPNKIWL